MFIKQTIKDIDLEGKTVLLRADYNVPISNGIILDDFRISQSLPTVKFLLSKNVKLIICSHLGRPDGVKNDADSLFPVAKKLQYFLKQPVQFVPDCMSDEVPKIIAKMVPGSVLLLENLRFYAEEEQNNEEFARHLASYADIFVQDGFGVVHRAHASTSAVTHFLPSVAGLLLEKEVDTISNVMENPQRPLMAIIGGAKIADKIDILHRFIEIADVVAIGGAMANTFLASQGVKIGKSLYDEKELPIARDVIRKAGSQVKKRDFKFILPFDVVVSKEISNTQPTRIVDLKTHSYAEINNYPKRPPLNSFHILNDDIVLDVGPFSGSFIAGNIQFCKTVIWNGTMGVTEVDSLLGSVGPYSHGTDLIVKAMVGEFGNTPFSVVGGGDTVSYVTSHKLLDCFDLVSTGGGASLELMAGRRLPGVEALLNKNV